MSGEGRSIDTPPPPPPPPEDPPDFSKAKPVVDDGWDTSPTDMTSKEEAATRQHDLEPTVAAQEAATDVTPPDAGEITRVEMPIDVHAVQDIEPMHPTPQQDLGPTVAGQETATDITPPDAGEITRVEMPIDVRAVQAIQPMHPATEATRDSPPDLGGWKPSDSESELANRVPTGMTEINPQGHINEAFKVDFADGTHGAYKPQSGEYTKARDAVPDGSCGQREVATSRLDDMLEFDKVPTTTAWSDNGEHGPGSLQEWAEHTGPGLPVQEYSQADQQRMAVLDYVGANSDRHDENYLTRNPGDNPSPVAIDHGYCFPESPTDPIRSDFVAAQLGHDLEPDVLEQVRAVDPNEAREMLSASGMNPSAVEGAVDRLEEVQRNGAITGQAWNGRICDGRGRDVR